MFVQDLENLPKSRISKPPLKCCNALSGNSSPFPQPALHQGNPQAPLPPFLCDQQAPAQSLINRFETRQQAIAQITEYIELFYNRQRLQARLGYLSPATFEQHFYPSQPGKT